MLSFHREHDFVLFQCFDAEKVSLAGIMAAKRAPTAFFIFSEEQREATRAECQAQAEPRVKVSVGAVAKAIGEKWRALTDEEKASYKEKVAERAKALASAAADSAPAAGVALPAF